MNQAFAPNPERAGDVVGRLVGALLSDLPGDPHGHQFGRAVERKRQMINMSDVAAVLIVIVIGRWDAVVSG